jgi:hypothetical protein
MGPGVFCSVTIFSAFIAVTSSPTAMASSASSAAMTLLPLSVSSATLSHSICVPASPDKPAMRAMRSCMPASAGERLRPFWLIASLSSSTASASASAPMYASESRTIVSPSSGRSASASRIGSTALAQSPTRFTRMSPTRLRISKRASPLSAWASATSRPASSAQLSVLSYIVRSASRIAFCAG